ncbi:MAG TPA: hypothetical protein VN046_04075 [Stenotrophobium sp.]|nr:hypothetical protein [Stenotrophobium sp.]
MKLLLPLIAATALLAGCASDGSGHCGSSFDYQKAASLAPVTVQGLSTGAAVSALVVPPEPARIVPFARQVPDPKKPSDTRTVCLDAPPAMPQYPVAMPAASTATVPDATAATPASATPPPKP